MRHLEQIKVFAEQFEPELKRAILDICHLGIVDGREEVKQRALETFGKALDVEAGGIMIYGDFLSAMERVKDDLS
jgi:hypothetical protein